MNNNASLCERGALALARALRRHALPVTASLVFGLLAHLYAFTNKLVNADETAALFSKGATLTSGRWGLEMTSLLFPDVSMPWIYGVLSLLFVTAAVCMVLEMFSLRRKITQILLPGIFLSFPALTGNFCYMFTSASYALAIFLAVAAVALFRCGGRMRTAAGCLLLAFALGVYQAYISLAASLCVLLAVKKLMEGESSARACLRFALLLFARLVVALALYYAVTFAVETALDSGFQSYEVTAKHGLLRGVVTAYTAFAGIFLGKNFGYVNTPLSVLAHFACAALTLGTLAAGQRKARDGKKAALLLVLLILYPLSVNCMYLIASSEIIHSLVVFSFVSFYVLTAMALEALPEKLYSLRAAAAFALSLILAGNVYFANKVYLKMALEYENAYAFYNTLMAEIMDTPGFREYTVIDLVGNCADGFTRFDEIDTSGFTGPNDDLVNIYTRVSFIRYYLGLDLYMYREDTIYNAPWFDEMPCYPAEGSILYQPDQNRIVVKLG